MRAGVAGTVASALLWGAAPAGAAQPAAKAEYPARPVRFIVGQTPGGNADFIARVIAGELTKRFGQQFVVENRGGASGMIAAELAVRAPPDGQSCCSPPVPSR